MKQTAVVALAAAGLLTLPGCGTRTATSTPTPTPPLPLTARGVITVYPGNIVRNNTTCDLSRSGYADIPGSQIVIKDPSGTIVATGAIAQAGTVTLTLDSGPDKVQVACEYTWSAPNVPRGLASYEVSMGRRGSHVYQEAELEDVRMKLGGS